MHSELLGDFLLYSAKPPLPMYSFPSLPSLLASLAAHTLGPGCINAAPSLLLLTSNHAFMRELSDYDIVSGVCRRRARGCASRCLSGW